MKTTLLSLSLLYKKNNVEMLPLTHRLYTLMSFVMGNQIEKTNNKQRYEQLKKVNLTAQCNTNVSQQVQHSSQLNWETSVLSQE